MSAGDQPELRRRLFVGTFLSATDSQRLAALQQYDERLREAWNYHLRWVRAEKLHLTWHFLGYVKATLTGEIVEKLTGALKNQPPLKLTYSNPVIWPDIRQPRHFVLGPDAVPEPVRLLQERLGNILGPYFETPQEKVFRPHITLFRLERGRGAITVPAWLPLNDVLPLTQDILELDLIESHFGTARTGYTSVQKFVLQ